MSKTTFVFFSLLFANLILAQENNDPKYIKTFNQSKVLIEEGWKQNDKKIKYWYYYHSNGNIKAKVAMVIIMANTNTVCIK